MRITETRIGIRGASIALLVSWALLIHPVPGNTSSPQADTEKFPPPVEVIIADKSAKKKFRLEREAWLESLHRARPGVDWKAIDRATRVVKNQKKNERRRDLKASGKLKSRSLKETLEVQRRSDRVSAESQAANSLIPSAALSNAIATSFSEQIAIAGLTGTWLERGSDNLAGRILHTDVIDGVIYALSAGGIVWAGDLSGNNWVSLNDFYKFKGDNIAALPITGATRIIVQAEQFVHYSDDGGLTWSNATGLKAPTDWGENYRMFVTGRESNPIVYISSIEWNYADWYAEHHLYKSTDLGETFTPVSTTTSQDLGPPQYAWAPRNSSQDLYLFDNLNLQLLEPDGTLSTLGNPLPTSTPLSDIRRIMLGGNHHGIGGTLYAAVERTNGQTEVYVKSDGVPGWASQGVAPTFAFTDNSFQVSSENPSVLFLGGIDAFSSTNGGVSWSPVNYWYEYYADEANKLHADVPHIGSFTDNSGNEYFLVSTDGGVYISTDQLSTVSNLSLAGLRISQYYSVYSNPLNPDVIFGGSQDQGLQRTLTDPGGVLNFDQMISGDYGQLTSGDNGNSVWAVYPGFVIYAPQATLTEALVTRDFEHSASSPPLWMPPTMADPSDGQSVFVGGGATTTSGARLWHYSYNGSSLNFTELPFDFGLGQATRITAMAYSPIDPNHRYVMTEPGNFFHSDNGGASWTLLSSLSNFGGHYLTGLAIVPSTVQLGEVYIGGSGYSNPAVYVSSNHGLTFTASANGLPSTLVLDMEMAEDGTKMYAATEVGPYAFIVADSQWYDMAGISGPDQAYWSIDTGLSDRIRFATYGRGIWDFNIAPHQITVTSPNGGEVWVAGATETVTWTEDNLPPETDEIKILLYDAASSSFHDLAGGISPGVESASVTVPGIETLDAIIFVGSLGGGEFTITDISDAPFSIVFMDTDGDGVYDHLDNCISISNPGQEPSTIKPSCGQACVTSNCAGTFCENH